MIIISKNPVSIGIMYYSTNAVMISDKGESPINIQFKPTNRGGGPFDIYSDITKVITWNKSMGDVLDITSKHLTVSRKILFIFEDILVSI